MRGSPAVLARLGTQPMWLPGRRMGHGFAVDLPLELSVCQVLFDNFACRTRCGCRLIQAIVPHADSHLALGTSQLGSGAHARGAHALSICSLRALTRVRAHALANSRVAARVMCVERRAPPTLAHIACAMRVRLDPLGSRGTRALVAFGVCAHSVVGFALSVVLACAAFSVDAKGLAVSKRNSLPCTHLCGLARVP